MKSVLIVLLSCLWMACATSQPATHADTSVSGAAAQTCDGSSFEKAIVIKASNEMDGIAQEYKWIEKHYPGYKKGSQSLVNHNGRAYDVLQFTDAQGVGHEVYFDITSFYGKW